MKKRKLTCWLCIVQSYQIHKGEEGGKEGIKFFSFSKAVGLCIKYITLFFRWKNDFAGVKVFLQTLQIAIIP